MAYAPLAKRPVNMPPPPNVPRPNLSVVPPPPPKTLGEDYSTYPRAGFWERGIAVFVDGFLSGIAGQAVAQVFKIALGSMLANSAAAALVLGGIQLVAGLGIGVALILYPLKKGGQTPGKKLMGLRVCNSDGQGEMSWGQVLKREYVGKLISALLLGIGFLMALGKNKQALHDRMSNTMVVKLRKV